MKIVKIFGLALAEDGSSFNFNGEIVKYDKQSNSFCFDNKTYTAHPKQTEEVSLLYPNEIWVREPDVHSEDPNELVVNQTDISNGYARRGSHWVRYFIDPASLVIIGEEDEKKAELLALEFADIIVSKEKLIKAFKDVGITDINIISDILEKL